MHEINSSQSIDMPPKYAGATRGTKAQEGFVLIVALIVLVAMSLAAAGLMRSVDAGAGVAGNIAFRESAVASVDNGIEQAVQFLTVNRGLALLNAASPADGYYPIGSNTSDWSRFDWANNAKHIAKDASGNSVDYVIERMCQSAGQPFGTNPCVGKLLTQDDPEAGNGHGAGAANYTVTQLGYRISARVTDPKSSATYIQVFAY